MKKLLAALPAVLISMAGCSGSSSPPSEPQTSSFTVSGTVTAEPLGLTAFYSRPQTGLPCRASTSDLRAGAQVVVSGEDGTTLALGAVGKGQLVKRDAWLCSFSFSVPGVPSGHPFYKVQVAGKGGVQYTESDLRQPLHLSLG